MTKLSVYYNSHQAYYKDPFGAVPCGQRVLFRIGIIADKPVNGCFLRLWEQESRENLVPMICTVNEIDESVDRTVRQIFETTYTSKEPGLVWYYFRLHINEQIYFYGNNQEELGGEGVLCGQEPSSYQIMIYLPSKIPLWYKKGIMYQIFVDRFYNGSLYQEVSNPKKRSLIHGNWQDTPFYIKDQQGRIQRWTFFGGNLKGVIQKLSYLQELGISIVYFNPIFEAASNHKYDTGDYHRIDPMFGDEDTFQLLIQEAEKRGIRIILDGVFSHTGSDSIYFNKDGCYPSLGAYQSSDSPYRKWFRFNEECSGQSGQYECWWGVEDLPNVEEMEPTYRVFIYRNEDSVIRHWMKKGVKGWRLDVADELPDAFIKELRTAVKTVDPESVLIGEVCEDASRKESYGVRREYLWGEELDAVMNYPWRSMLIQYLLGHIDAGDLHHRIMSLFENYPWENFLANMNIIGSHDRIRILTLLGEAPAEDKLEEKEREEFRLSEDARGLAAKRLALLSLIQMTFPGVPCIYYGDEAGMEGYADPYNRGPYPWGREDTGIQQWYKKILRLRQEYDVLTTGEFNSFFASKDVYGFTLRGSEEEFTVLINRSLTDEAEIPVSPSIFSDGDDKQRNGRMVSLELLSGEKILENDSSEENNGVQEQTLFLTVKLNALEGKTIYSRKSYPAVPKLERSCGILLHLTSLPSHWGVGDMGEEAEKFVDFLKASGQKLWQILPLNPAGFGFSPYQSSSVFAGNTLMISIEALVDQGLITEEEASAERLDLQRQVFASKATFSSSLACKQKLLRLAYTRFQTRAVKAESLLRRTRGHELYTIEDYVAFQEENQAWLDDYCLYIALKNHFGGLPWYEWKKTAAYREEETLSVLKKDCSDEIGFERFQQYIFFRQWQNLKKYANSRGISIIGDLPIYVAEDSCDTWVNKELFELDSAGRASVVAGVPPDYFSETGQHWGNPLYNWQGAEKTGYAWWKHRIRHNLKMYDYIRLDHFRGFEGYWEIPAGEVTAVNGRWRKGPGKAFFESLLDEFGTLPVIAEDLGFITPEVHNLRHIFGFPGMKILLFDDAFPEEDRHSLNTVYYTGTHDNDTLLGWYKERLVQTDSLWGSQREEMAAEACRSLIIEIYKSNYPWVIIPLQDALLLDSQARMNTPGTTEGNWEWRMAGALTPKESQWLLELACQYNRTS